MIKIAIKIGVMFVAVASYGQYSGESANNYNSDYNRARREVQSSYEKQADLNRQPNSPGGGSAYKYMTQAEMDAFDDQLRKASGRPSLAEERAAREKIEKERKEKYEQFVKKEAAWKAEYFAQADREKAALQPTVDRFIADGFYPEEADNMSRVNKLNTDEAPYFNENVIYSKKYLDFLKENSRTETFENLEFNIYRLIKVNASVTAFDYMQKLEYRFFDKQVELYRLKLAIYVNFFKSYGFTRSFGNGYEGKMKQIIDSYMELEETNPELFIDFDQATDGLYFFGPYNIIDTHYKFILDCKACDDKDAKRFAKKEKEKYANRYQKMKRTFYNCICKNY
jgi:hypothetical protein